jgi:glycerol-3-phosphate acyltransferase PlsY
MNYLLVLLAYLIGSIPFSYLVARFIKGVDLRAIGSGNLGATNVSRGLGLGWGLLVLALDAAKGFLPVFLFPGLSDGTWNRDLVMIMVAAGVVIGHIFPVYLGFRGGKGAASGLGTCLAMIPKATIIILVVFLITVLLTRFVSLGSIMAALSMPFAFMGTDWSRAMGDGTPILCGTVLLAALVVFRHRSNIVRLVHGKEERFGGRRPPGRPAP